MLGQRHVIRIAEFGLPIGDSIELPDNLPKLPNTHIDGRPVPLCVLQ